MSTKCLNPKFPSSQKSTMTTKQQKKVVYISTCTQSKVRSFHRSIIKMRNSVHIVTAWMLAHVFFHLIHRIDDWAKISTTIKFIVWIARSNELHIKRKVMISKFKTWARMPAGACTKGTYMHGRQLNKPQIGDGMHARIAIVDSRI